MKNIIEINTKISLQENILMPKLERIEQLIKNCEYWVAFCSGKLNKDKGEEDGIVEDSSKID